jgi:ATP-dependent DNA helicase RecG
MLKEYIGKANAAGRIGYVYSNKGDILNRLDLSKADKINNAAKVMFCDKTNLEIQMATFATNERLTFIDISRESGTISELVDLAENYIKKTMRWRVEFDGSIQRREIPEVPIDAVREALVNSYCHRAYRVHQTNEVAIFKNRIEIYNPGTFPAGLTPQDFLESSERSIQRNPLLAQILYYSKDIEKFGTGLQRIANACKDADVRVEFKMLKLGFAVVFYRDEKVVDYLGHVVKDKPTDIPDNFPDIPDNFPDIPDNKTREVIVTEYLKINDFITNKKVCELFQLSDEAAKKFLQSMAKKGLIVAEGEKRGRRYKLLQNAP